MRVIRRWMLRAFVPAAGGGLAVLLSAGSASAAGLAVTPTTPANPTTDTPLTWDVTTTDASATSCELDYGTTVVDPVTDCAGTVTYSVKGGPAGTYTLVAYNATAADVTAGSGGTPVTSDVVVAPTAPTPSGPTGPSSDLTPQFSLGLPTGATGTCTLTAAGGTVVDSADPCPDPWTADLTGRPDGTYTLSVTATQAGQTSVATTLDYTLDTTAPSAPGVKAPTSPGNDTSPTFTISGVESGARVDCSATGPGGAVSVTSCTATAATLSIGSGADGDYTLTVTATDAAGNTSTGGSDTYTLDATPPPAPTVTGVPTLTNSTKVTLGISAGEAGDTLTCLLTSPGGRTVFSGTCPAGGTFDTTGYADGTYTLVATATDAAGNTRSRTVTWDRDTTPPPAPAVSGPTTPTNDRTPTLTVTDAEPAVTYTCTISGPGAASVSVCSGSTTLDITGADGDYTVSVVAHDAAGNTSSATFTVTLDTVAPPAPVLSAATDPTNDRTPGLAVTDSEPGVTYTCSVSGPGAAAVTACDSSTTLDISGGDGDYVVTVTAHDAAGNTSSSSVTITLDTTPPPPPSVTGAPALTDSRTVTVTISDAEAGVTITCRLTAPGGAVVTSGACPAGGTFDTTGFGDGTYTLRVTATDAAGNTSSSAVTWDRDTVAPPAPSVTAPPSPAQGRSPSFTVADGEAGVTYTCTVSGPTVVDVTSCGTTTTVDLSTAADGTYTLTVHAVDAAGNISPATTATYTLDTTPPTAPSVSSPPALTNARSITLTISDKDAGVALTCRLTAPDGAVVTSGACPAGGGFDTTGFGDGTYTLVVTASDAAGNASRTTVTWTRDTVAPPAPSVSAPPALTNSRTVTLSIGDSEAGVTLTCRLTAPGGAVVFGGACPAGGSFDTTGYGDGTYALVVTATDAAGNSSSTSVSWKRDTTPPPAPSVSAPATPGNGRSPSFTVTDAEAGVTYTCGVSGPSAVSVTTCGPTTTLDLTGAVDGVYTLTVTALDAAGNPSSSTSADYELDTAAPPAPVVSAPPALTNSTSIAVTISDTESGVALSCVVTSPGGRVVSSGACPATGSFDTTGYADGIYTLVVTATDAAGNSASTSVQWTRDTTPPPAPSVTGAPTLTNSTVVVLAVADGESGVSLTCVLTAPDGSVVLSGGCPGSGRFDTTEFGDGGYTLVVRATDAAGNSSTTTVTWTRDTAAPPAPTITAPPSPAQTRSPSFTVSDTESGVTYACTVSGPSNVDVTACGRATTLDLSVAADGTYTVTVVAVDAAGNISSSSSASFTLDTTAPPAPSVSSPPSLTNSVTVSVNISDGQSAVSLTCVVTSPGGRTVSSGACPANGTFDTTGFADGVYTLVVTATDSAGNSSTTTVTWRRDTTPPPPPTVRAPASPAQDRSPSFAVTDTEPGVVFSCSVSGPATVSVTTCGATTTLDLGSAPDGVYTLSVTATDAAGNTSLVQTATYILDTTAPAAPTVRAPASPAQGRSPSFTVTDPEAGVTFTCTVSGPDTVAVTSCGATTTLDLTGAADGVYTVTVRAVDAAGNVSSGSSATYTLDTTAPSAPSVTGLASLTNSRVVTATITEAERGVTLTCVVTAPGGRMVFSGGCPGSGAFDTTGFADGTYTLVVTATDAAGNSSSVAVTWTRDTVAPPAPTVTAPRSPSQNRTPGFAVTDAESGVTYQCTVSGPSSVSVSQCGPTTKIDLSGASDGTYTVTVAAVDAAGNVSVATSAGYTLDTTAPATPNVAAPASPAQGRHPSFTVSGVETGGVVTCTLSTPIGSTATVPVSCAANVTLDLTGQPDGDYTLSVTVTDAAGNVSSASMATYILDTTAPAAPEVTPPSSPSNDTAPTFTVVTEPGATLTCTVQRYFQTLWTGSCPVGNTFDLSGYADGEFEITFTATDTAGNTGPSTTVTYLLDTTTPAQPVLSAPASPSPITHPSWLWTAEAGTTATCTITDGSGNVVAGPVSCTSPYTGNFAGLPDGTYRFTVTVTDAAGNVSPAATDVFVLDRQAPVPPTVAPPRSPDNDRSPQWTISGPRGAVLTCKLIYNGQVIWGPAVCPADGIFSLAGLPDGTYTLRVTATDAAGNISAAAVTTYVLDTAPPAAPTLDYGTASPSSDTSPFWGFSLPAGTTGRCQLWRGSTLIATHNNCQGAVTFDLSGRAQGTYTVRIYAVDLAGNVSKPLEITYVLGSPSTPAGGRGGTSGGSGGTGGSTGSTGSTGPTSSPSGGTRGPTAVAVTPPLPGVVRQTIQRLDRLAGIVKSTAKHTVQHVEHTVSNVLPVIHDRFTENVSHAVQGVVKGLSTAGGGTGFPLMLLFVVLAFLLVQNRIDRRDPKLALASVAADDTVEFLPPPSRGGRR